MIQVVWKRLRSMSEVSFTILRGGMLVACTLLICSLAIMLAAGPANFSTYYMHACAMAMFEMAPGILLITVIASAWCESNAARKR